MISRDPPASRKRRALRLRKSSCRARNFPPDVFELFAREVVAGIALYLRKMQRHRQPFLPPSARKSSSTIMAAGLRAAARRTHSRKYFMKFSSSGQTMFSSTIRARRRARPSSGRGAELRAQSRARESPAKLCPSCNRRRPGRRAGGGTCPRRGRFVEGRVPLRHEKKETMWMSADPSLDILAMSAACSPIFPSKSIAMSSISTPPPELPARAGCAANAMQKFPKTRIIFS